MWVMGERLVMRSQWTSQEYRKPRPTGAAMVQTLTPEQLNAQYNNRALVPDFQRHLDDWARRSEQARQAPGVLDVAYGTGEGETLDIFFAQPGGVQAGLPARAGKAPVLVFIHGGYWRSLDKRDHSFVAPPFTAQGVCVVVVNYALCPQVTVPHITLQMVRALAWVHDAIGAYGGDCANITVVGHSAGGHLAAMLLSCQWAAYRADLPTHLVRKAVSISGLFDLEPIRQTPFLQASLQLTPEQVRLASPAYFKPPANTRLFAVVGGQESAEFRRQNRLIVQSWGSATVPVCDSLQGLNHFSILETLAQTDQRLHQMCLGMAESSSGQTQ
jgi:arylformamidase